VKVVVTGGAGFIGANLVGLLTEDPAVSEITVMDDLSTGARSNVADLDVEFVEASILDRAALRKAVAGAASIVHLAAIPSVPRSVKDPVASHLANATGTLEVLQAARETGAHVVVASSSSVYGANRELPKRESMRTAPISPYAVSKLATEAYAIAYGHTYELDVLAFRFFNVYGPLQAAGHAYAAVIPAFVDAGLRDEPVTVHGDGEQTRDFTYVGTVCHVLADAVRRRVTSLEPVNLAFGTRTSLLELIAGLEAAIGHEIGRRHIESRAGDVRDSQADNSRLLELFPDVKAASLDEGLEQTVQWFRSLPDYSAN
jgi:UDP-glucose 4-epimerase